MALFDPALDELEKYRSELPEPADFDAFRQETAARRAYPFNDHEGGGPAHESRHTGMAGEAVGKSTRIPSIGDECV